MPSRSMPAVVHYALKPGAVEIREMPVPDIGENDVLLRVRGASVCGSDLHHYHNTMSWRVNVPVILGHEFCGEVAQVGRNVKNFREGDRVASETAAEIDENSPLSRGGQYNIDPHRRGFGALINGAMAHYVRVPARCLHRLPASVPFDVAALTEPSCVSYQAVVVNARIRPGDTAVVLGPGPIGLLCAQMAKLCGAGHVLLVGISKDKSRLEIGVKQMGATAGLDSQTQDVAAELQKLGDGLGADVVVDAAGVSATLKQAIDWVRPGGHIVKVGWGPQPVNFSLDPLVQKAATLQGSFSHTWNVWERVIRLVASGQFNPRPLISRVAPLAEWKPCFDGMSEGGLIKAVLTP